MPERRRFARPGSTVSLLTRDAFAKLPKLLRGDSTP
jgi:hypothetical protein